LGKYAVIIVVLFALAVFTFVRILWDYPLTPSSNDPKTITVEIPKGASLKAAIYTLERHGIVSHPLYFILMCKIIERSTMIKAGEYELRATMTPLEIFQILAKGAYKKHYITIPEGYTLNQIANLLLKEQLIDREIFSSLTHDKEFIKSLGINASSLEGYLFPDSYEFTKGSGERFILTKMVNRFQEVFTDAFKKRAEELKLSLHSVVTLASMIEKEAKSAEEKGLVSAVYHNRLKKNMPLQCDPTIIYVLGENFDGVLKNKLLNINSPYNTYKYPGLPPGPIANPGKESILAALYPAKTEYLYFVSTNNGFHKFSKSYSEHLIGVREFREKREMLKKKQEEMQEEINFLDSK